MKINKIKALSVAVCCFVTALWAEVKCMEVIRDQFINALPIPQNIVERMENAENKVSELEFLNDKLKKELRKKEIEKIETKHALEACVKYMSPHGRLFGQDPEIVDIMMNKATSIFVLSLTYLNGVTLDPFVNLNKSKFSIYIDEIINGFLIYNGDFINSKGVARKDDGGGDDTPENTSRDSFKTALSNRINRKSLTTSALFNLNPGVVSPDRMSSDLIIECENSIKDAIIQDISYWIDTLLIDGNTKFISKNVEIGSLGHPLDRTKDSFIAAIKLMIKELKGW